jgi:hypothetical protein
MSWQLKRDALTLAHAFSNLALNDCLSLSVFSFSSSKQLALDEAEQPRIPVRN